MRDDWDGVRRRGRVAPARTMDAVAAGADPRLESAVGAACGFGLMLVIAAVLTSVRRSVGADVGLGIFVCMVAVFGWWVRPVGLLATAGCAWLMLNGFVVDQLGDLRWHGSSDVRRLLILAGVAVAVCVLRSVQLSRQRRRTGGRYRQLRRPGLVGAVRPCRGCGCRQGGWQCAM